MRQAPVGSRPQEQVPGRVEEGAVGVEVSAGPLCGSAGRSAARTPERPTTAGDLRMRRACRRAETARCSTCGTACMANSLPDGGSGWGERCVGVQPFVQQGTAGSGAASAARWANRPECGDKTAATGRWRAHGFRASATRGRRLAASAHQATPNRLPPVLGSASQQQCAMATTKREYRCQREALWTCRRRDRTQRGAQ